MTTLIWFNEDGLNPEHPMVQDHPQAAKVFIFDLPYLQQWQTGKHRVQFIYESLLEIPDIQIYKGETVAVLRQLVTEGEIRRVVTTATPNHPIRAWQREVQQFAGLEVYPDRHPGQDARSLRRFSRYWRQYDRAWLTP